MPESQGLPQPASPLGYQNDRAYLASGAINSKGFVIALVGGIVAAVLSGVAVWLFLFLADSRIDVEVFVATITIGAG